MLGLYLRCQTVKRGKNIKMNKKSHQKFSALKWKFFLFKQVIQKFFRPPKLGAKSPPMVGDYRRLMHINKIVEPDIIMIHLNLDNVQSSLCVGDASCHGSLCKCDSIVCLELYNE